MHSRGPHHPALMRPLQGALIDERVLGTMPRGDKTKYTDKQIREADHITESYESRGVPEDEAERRAWATVNKESGGGKKSGAGRGQLESRASSRKGSELGGQASANRSAAERLASAKKAAATHRRHTLS